MPAQDNVFNNDTEAIIPKAQVLTQGMSISEFIAEDAGTDRPDPVLVAYQPAASCSCAWQTGSCNDALSCVTYWL